ncbi:hypothetical protein DPX16_20074 [Anabarilius grahami]|uniref:Uncharacterized protein n=1 Tax=Anabarilius grahami TaxID=495550 RepID=A0A3N0XRG4_ANAGA|nr:hypothetical protein DPX16_20074 [Anabarilius grahami]
MLIMFFIPLRSCYYENIRAFECSANQSSVSRRRPDADSTCQIGRKKADEDQPQPTVWNTLRKLSRPTKKNCPTADRRLGRNTPNVESASELVGPSGHLIILIGCSDNATCWFGKAFHLTQAQNGRATWPSAVYRWFGVSGQLRTQTLPT